MKNTDIKQIAFAAIMGLFLSACGGGSSSTTSFPDEVKVPECGNATDMGKAIAADITGKIIEKIEDGAEVRIWHASDGTKLACMIIGEANILDN